MLDSSANPIHIPLFAGRELGFFQDQGLHIEIHRPLLDDSLYHLENEQADFTISYLPRILRATAKGRDFFVVGKLIEKPLNGFVFLQKSGIKRVEDFNGRHLGYDAAHCTTSLLQALLNAKNVEFSSRVNSANHAISDLINGGIDVVYGALETIEPLQIENRGIKSGFFSVTDFGMPEYEECIVVARGTMRKDLRFAKKFETALQRSIDYCLSNPDAAFELYKKKNSDKTQATLEWEQKSWQKTISFLPTSQDFSKPKLRQLVDWLREEGLLYSNIKLKPHFLTFQYPPKSVSDAKDNVAIGAEQDREYDEGA